MTNLLALSEAAAMSSSSGISPIRTSPRLHAPRHWFAHGDPRLRADDTVNIIQDAVDMRFGRGETADLTKYICPARDLFDENKSEYTSKKKWGG